MFRSSSLLRKKICFALAMCYLVGIFHQPILEGWHFLCHMDDLVKGNYRTHQLTDHEEGHQHKTIDLVNDLIDQSENEKEPIDKNVQNDLKKFPQITHNQQIRHILFSPILQKPFSRKHLISHNFSKTFFPPPKV